MDQSCLSSILPRRIRTPPKSRNRSYVQDTVEGEDGRLMKEKISPQKRPIVPIHRDRLDVQSFPVDSPKQVNPSSRRALSGLGHAVDGLRLFCRRPPCKSPGSDPSPQGPKQRVHRVEVLFDSRIDTNKELEYKSPTTSKTSRWLQHCAAATFRPRRRLHIIPETCCEPSSRPNEVVSPLPGSCMKPPRIPHNLTSGAAARAAAATQNEILESIRNQRPVEPKIPRDSESGVGIELQDRWEENKDEVVRKGQWSMPRLLWSLLIWCARLCLYSARRADGPHPILSRRELVNQRGVSFPQVASVSKFTSYMETNILQWIQFLLSARYHKNGSNSDRRFWAGESGTRSGLEEHVESTQGTQSTMAEWICRSNISRWA